jgi:hypothetical protein
MTIQYLEPFNDLDPTLSDLSSLTEYSCPFCALVTEEHLRGYPAHTPSSACVSGQANHCNCDVCY